MPDITLYNQTGQAVTYEGVEEIVTDTPDGEKTVKFSYGEVVEGTEIELDLAEGDQTVSVPAGYLVKEATIKKPETLVPEYIKKNVEIAGVVGEFAGDEMEKTVDLAMADGDQVIEADEDTVLTKVTVRKPETLVPENIISGITIGGITGTHEAPKLYAPTAVTGPTEDTTGLYYYTVANPTASNGVFADTVLVVTSSDTVLAEIPCTGATTKIYASDFTEINKVVLANFYARFAGEGFVTSDKYNKVANIFVIQIFEYSLQNVTLNSQPKRVYQQDKITIIASAGEGYYLPKEISFLLSDGTVASFTASYDPETGTIIFQPGTYDFTEGVINVCIAAVDTQWVRMPTVLRFEDNILVVEYGDYSELLVVYVDGDPVAQLEAIPTLVEVTTEVTTPSSVSYGFELDSDGYYTSANKGVTSSYAMSRIDIVTNSDITLLLDCICYGESNYDYGLISKIDTSLAFSNTADASVFKTFKGASSSSLVRVEYPVTAGEHYIYMKYIKDSSGNSGADTFRFKIAGYEGGEVHECSIELSEWLDTYGTHQIAIVGTAEGYTDSDETIYSVDVMPIIYVNAGVLTTDKIFEGVTDIQIYIDDVLVDTVSYTDDTFSIVLEQYVEDLSIKHSVYIVAIGDGINANKSNVIEEYLISENSYTPIYGVSGMYSSTVALTRTDDAVDMSYAINDDGTVNSDFDNVFPWAQATVVTDASGNKFVQMPRMFFRVGFDSDNNITNIAVSELPRPDGEWYRVEPFCVGCYSGYISTDLKSVPGVTPSTSSVVTRAKARTAAANTGDNYHQYDLYHNTVLNFLWWIEWATKKSTDIMTGAVSGTGTTGGSAKVVTGKTDELTTPSGYELTRHQMRYHYIEDFVGNVQKCLDGVYAYKYGTSNYDYVTADHTKFSDTTAGMNKLCYCNPGTYSNACIASYGWDPDNPFLCVPHLTVGNSSYDTYFCAGYGNLYNSSPVMYQGSNYAGLTSNGGVGFVGLTTTAGYSAWVGARLMYAGTLVN